MSGVQKGVSRRQEVVGGLDLRTSRSYGVARLCDMSLIFGCPILQAGDIDTVDSWLPR